MRGLRLFCRCRVMGAWLHVVGVVCPGWFRFRRKKIRIYMNDRWHVLKDGGFVHRD
ncbi:MAG: hypothetical protein HN396_15570 [Gemmatimonadales bacterium]|jgi:hypothetical protein|nr:hypothetical protein [Gemmatimonadales bacterium]